MDWSPGVISSVSIFAGSRDRRGVLAGHGSDLRNSVGSESLSADSSFTLGVVALKIELLEPLGSPLAALGSPPAAPVFPISRGIFSLFMLESPLALPDFSSVLPGSPLASLGSPPAALAL